jgi:hypothetical protein
MMAHQGLINQFIHNKLTSLLLSLVIIFMLAPFSSSVIGNLVMSLLFLITNLLIVNILFLSTLANYALRAVAVFACVLDLSYSSQIINYNLIALLSNLLYALFILLAIMHLSKVIFKQNCVDLNVLNGGIAVFLLSAFFWYNLYIIVLSLDASAFKGLSTQAEQQYQMFYYSFVTITTLGYGDITPVNKIAMSLANAEAIVGLLFPAIFIARLVSLYTTSENNGN